MMRMIALAAAAALTPAGRAEIVDDGEGQGGGTKWAVVIGLNYAKNERPKKLGEIGQLDNAENDAEKFAGLLKKYFGYEEGHVILVRGAAATRDRLAELFSNKELYNKARIGPRDSVLVFYSGHGHVETSGGRWVPFLLPHDIDMTGGPDGKKPVTASKGFNLADAVKGLAEKCPAQHKLLILDCCHSGAVFELDVDGRRAMTEWDAKNTTGALREKAFQAMAASRSSEKASDGPTGQGHSPFTKALLRALEVLGREAARPERDGRRHFTFSELADQVRRYADDGMVPPSQSPMAMRLTAARGEFHFFLADGADFPDRPLTAEQRKALMAIVPSTFGNWWADEIPWFMPALRKRIVEEAAAGRSADALIDREALKQAAALALKKARDELEAGSVTEGDPRRVRVELMGRIFAAARTGLRSEVIEDAVGDLAGLTLIDPSAATADDADERLRVKGGANPADLHYLAVLCQKKKRFKLAARLYREAAARYEGGTELKALCLMDHGVLELNHLRTDDHAEAVRLFRQARKEFYDKKKTPPAPFEMFVLCREADAYRQQGNLAACRERFREAFRLADQWDRDRHHLLTAAAVKHRAWGHMEMWNLDPAAKDFEAVREILRHPDNAARPEAVVDLLHAEHGLAMALRFQGGHRGALDQYRKLTVKIERQIGKVLNAPRLLSNRAEMLYLLHTRLVNTLGRQADCNLFAPPAGRDLRDAADDYRRAVQRCDRLPPDKAPAAERDLLYRWAVALSLGEEPLDPARAADLYRRASQIPLAAGQEESRTRVMRLFARELIAASEPELLADEGDGVRRESLCDALADRRGRLGGFNRDELERSMMALAWMIRRDECAGANKYRALGRVERLLGLCRTAWLSRSRREDGNTDPNLLRFLRPYYDAAFLKKKELGCPAKELVEVAWEATRGRPYHKLASGHSVLAVYFAGGQCHLVLDRAGAAGVCYPARGEHWRDAWSQKEVRGAGAGTAPSPLPLPDKLRVALRELNCEKLWCRWRDPCLDIGFGTPRVTRFRPPRGPMAGLMLPARAFNGTYDVDAEDAFAAAPRE